MAEWVIERLGRQHQRSEFSCGKAPLDTFLRSLVSQYEKRRLGRTYVAVEMGHSRVAGYYTVSAGSFDVSCLPEEVRAKLPAHPMPTIHLGRLAVDLTYRGNRLGETLLFHALALAAEFSNKVGAFAVDLWSIDEEAINFYRKYGFVQLQDDPAHLYLPMKTVEAMFQG
jgi:ribosomal protein S18 acetylase RimI-like enzyme